MSTRVARALTLGVLLVALGCSGYQAFREAEIAERNGDWDEAVLHYLELTNQYPSNISYRAGLLRAKTRASQEHFERAKKLHEVGSLEQALREYQQTLQLDPSNQYALVEYQKVVRALAESDGGETAQSIDELKRQAAIERQGPPVLNPKSNEPISLNFPNKVSLRDIYRALGQAFGINIQFDSKLRDKNLSIELEEVTAQEALEFVMRAAGHFYKVLSENTIIVIEDNTQNRRAYEEQVIQTFFLSNAEVKEMLTLLRSLVGTKNIAANDQLNAIVVRDSADAVKVAERIIQANDKARGEVVVDVELLQINTTKLRELGVELTQYQITQTLDQDPPLRISDLEFLNQQNWEIILPGFIYNFVKTSSDAQLLANPQIRISDGEQASLTIGDRVPIPVTTFNSAQTVGGNIVPITSFQYQDVGIRLELEPRLHHNNEITLNVQVEVSSIAGVIDASAGAQPIISTRNIQSAIRLKDGETNFLAGLIRSDETTADTGVPGLSDIPILGRFFSNKNTDKRRTDLVLTLTPHIIRRPDITGEDLQPLWVGTEGNLTFRGGSPRVESEVEGPFDEEDDDEGENERIRDLIRRRIQSLPQGLRTDEQQGEGTPGVDLVPSSMPSDPFGRDDVDDDDDDDDNGDDNDNLARAAGSGRLPAMGAWAAYPQDGDVSEDVIDRAAAALTPAVGVRLVAARPEVEVGREVEIAVVALASEPVSHLPMTLSFDARRLEAVSVSPGEFLGGIGTATVLSDVSRPGRIVLGPSRLGQIPGVTGEGEVARITFRPLVEGPVRIRFSDLAALAPGLGEIESKPSGLRLTVVPAGTLPPQPGLPARTEIVRERPDQG